MNTSSNHVQAPIAIRHHRQTQSLIVQWNAADNHATDSHAIDSHATVNQPLTYRTLRAACPCARCRANRIQGLIPLVAADIEITAINPMGYGVQLVFSDGHDRGIFPWAFLRAL